MFVPLSFHWNAYPVPVFALNDAVAPVQIFTVPLGFTNATIPPVETVMVFDVALPQLALT